MMLWGHAPPGAAPMSPRHETETLKRPSPMPRRHR